MSATLRLFRSSPRFVIAALVLLFSHLAGAADGVLEINQACATGPGCFPGDAPGLPVTLNGSGSYRLTSNLGVNNLLGPPSTNLIEISATDVQLDLNGFTLRCSNTLTGAPCGSGSTMGIFVTGVSSGVRIRNGSIFGLPGDGVAAVTAQDLQVDDLLVRETGGRGIFVGFNSRVERCTVVGAGGDGISAATDASIVGNKVEDVSGVGISVGGSSVVRGNTSTSNGGAGFRVFGSSLVEGNAATNNVIGFSLSGQLGGLARENVAATNSGLGFSMGGEWVFTDNVVQDNNGGNANPQTSGGIAGSGNVCGITPGCP